MDVETLYNMAKAAAKGAAQMSGASAAGYAAYIEEYNRLVPLVIEQFGEEAKNLFQPIDIGISMKIRRVTPIRWAEYAGLATARLQSLTAYLQSKLGTVDRQVQAILDLVKVNLRPSIFKDPEHEKDIQNVLDVIFRARGLDYRREKVGIEYSSKRFFPDFTFESLDLTVEAKLSTSEKKIKEIVDEINADIPAYQLRYRRIIFVVYDLGFIRDINQFKASIESNPDVYVLVIKH